MFPNYFWPTQAILGRNNEMSNTMRSDIHLIKESINETLTGIITQGLSGHESNDSEVGPTLPKAKPKKSFTIRCSFVSYSGHLFF